MNQLRRCEERVLADQKNVSSIDSHRTNIAQRNNSCESNVNMYNGDSAKLHMRVPGIAQLMNHSYRSPVIAQSPL